MQTIQFCKMQALGNDFVVIDAIRQSLHLNQIPIARMAHRQLGIGFDQLLWIESADSPEADFSCRFFNADGSEAEQCGNGVRCVARFIQEQQLSEKKSLVLETKADLVKLTIKNNEMIEAQLGIPSFQPAAIPFIADTMQMSYTIEVANQTLQIAALSVGNPHAILQVKTIQNARVNELGKKIATHHLFPQGSNVGFVEVVNRQLIRLRTYERGVGETFACGSNACAAVVNGINQHELDHKVKVELTYGDLWVEWAGDQSPIIMTGPAEMVFSGVIQI